jgi:uncharacterized protein (TIGR00296 family)
MDLSPETRKSLLSCARIALEEYVGGKSAAGQSAEIPAHTPPDGIFVTVYCRGELRGCVGNLRPLNLSAEMNRPWSTSTETTLAETVQRLTLDASRNDSRFEPIRPRELPDVQLEISWLSGLRRVFSIEDIQPGTHGVYLRQGTRSGLLLPQVWEELPDRLEFMNALCTHKAGLPEGCWRDPGVELFIFTVEKISEKS